MGRGHRTNKQHTSCLRLHAYMFKFTSAYQKGKQKPKYVTKKKQK